MSDIFDEVEENVKADKLNQFWKMAWPFVLGGSIAIVGMVGAKSYFDDAAVAKMEANGRAFETGLKSLEIQDIEGARNHFGKVLDTDSGFADLSAQYLAQAELQLAGDTEAAANALKAAADGEGALAKLATIKAAYFLADTKTLSEIETALGDLVDDEGGFGALAHELIAAKAFDEGDLERARSEYQALTLRLNAPEGVRSRANEALAILPASVKVDAEADTAVTDETVVKVEAEQETVSEDASEGASGNQEDPS
ncbi:tetratricopeptide repeat protein [Hirschia litorea]|uniref:Tetratricopeptide repeat protein n=1 Tax=Hirschia litorea TaxID=1199156 RepID=A0ABW2IGT6_9PROT